MPRTLGGGIILGKRIGEECADESGNTPDGGGDQRYARAPAPSHMRLRRRDLPHPLKIPADALPEAYEGDRPYGSALYFLVAPDAQIVMHRIRSDQLYHHYMGDPLEVL